jgi:hypothetical protein
MGRRRELGRACPPRLSENADLASEVPRDRWDADRTLWRLHVSVILSSIDNTSGSNSGEARATSFAEDLETRHRAASRAARPTPPYRQAARIRSATRYQCTRASNAVGARLALEEPPCVHLVRICQLQPWRSSPGASIRQARVRLLQLRRPQCWTDAPLLRCALVPSDPLT